jgi:hypothetical protein
VHSESLSILPTKAIYTCPNLPNMGKLIPNSFNLLVVIYVALGSTACSYGMAIIGYVFCPNPRITAITDQSTALPSGSHLSMCP